jgi:hypothetical protein
VDDEDAKDSVDHRIIRSMMNKVSGSITRDPSWGSQVTLPEVILTMTPRPQHCQSDQRLRLGEDEGEETYDVLMIPHLIRSDEETYIRSPVTYQ